MLLIRQISPYKLANWSKLRLLGLSRHLRGLNRACPLNFQSESKPSFAPWRSGDRE
jgi:hypothetical protein